MQALGKFVIISPIKETQSQGGILYPDSDRNPNKGKVVSVPVGAFDFKVGDTVMFDGFHILEDSQYLFVRVEDLIAKL